MTSFAGVNEMAHLRDDGVVCTIAAGAPGKVEPHLITQRLGVVGGTIKPKLDAQGRVPRCQPQQPVGQRTTDAGVVILMRAEPFGQQVEHVVPVDDQHTRLASGQRPLKCLQREVPAVQRRRRHRARGHDTAVIQPGGGFVQQGVGLRRLVSRQQAEWRRRLDLSADLRQIVQCGGCGQRLVQPGERARRWAHGSGWGPAARY